MDLGANGRRESETRIDGAVMLAGALTRPALVSNVLTRQQNDSRNRLNDANDNRNDSPDVKTTLLLSPGIPSYQLWV